MPPQVKDGKIKFADRINTAKCAETPRGYWGDTTDCVLVKPNPQVLFFFCSDILNSLCPAVKKPPYSYSYSKNADLDLRRQACPELIVGKQAAYTTAYQHKFVGLFLFKTGAMEEVGKLIGIDRLLYILMENLNRGIDEGDLKPPEGLQFLISVQDDSLLCALCFPSIHPHRTNLLCGRRVCFQRPFFAGVTPDCPALAPIGQITLSFTLWSPCTGAAAARTTLHPVSPPGCPTSAATTCRYM